MALEQSSIFVTGTDTGVGKTLVSTALLHALARKSRRVVGMKPVAAGLVRSGDTWVSADVSMLRAASNVTVPPELDNPCGLRQATAPHLAARLARKRISVARLRAAHRALEHWADTIVIEGAGGWRVPLNEGETMADLAVAIGAPVVLVVGLRLGCLNHALLTAAAIRGDGLELAGWVANTIDPKLHDIGGHVVALRERLGASLLGVVPWRTQPAPRDIALCLPEAWS